MAKPVRGPLGGALAVGVAACLYGTVGPASRGAYDAGLTPLTFALWRAAVATLGVLSIIALSTLRGRSRLHWTTLNRRTLAALGSAVFAGGVANLALFSAFGRLSIAVALLGYFTYPAFVAIVAVAIGEERLGRGRLVALAIALFGMVVVVLGGSGESGSGPAFELAGFSLALLGAAMQAAYTLLGRRGFPSVPTEEATLVILGGTTFGFFLLTLVSGSLDTALLPFRFPSVLPLLIGSGVGGAAIPTLLFLAGVRSIGPTRAAIIALIEPLAGATLAAVLLAEALDPLQVAGGALVLAAAAILQSGGEAAEPHEATSGAA
jgi:DME family drug/metabolite transporter